MAFQRFEQVRAQRGTTYATIDKYGRLIVPQALADQVGLKPEMQVELYFDPQTRDIGIKVAPGITPYTVKVACTGMTRKDGSRPNCVIPLLTMLHAYGITLVHKLKGKMGVDTDGMMVFKIGEVISDPLPNNAALVMRGLESAFSVSNPRTANLGPAPEKATVNEVAPLSETKEETK